MVGMLDMVVEEVVVGLVCMVVRIMVVCRIRLGMEAMEVQEVGLEDLVVVEWAVGRVCMVCPRARVGCPLVVEEQEGILMVVGHTVGTLVSNTSLLGRPLPLGFHLGLLEGTQVSTEVYEKLVGRR